MNMPSQRSKQLTQGLVLYAKDKNRVSAFYRQTLGLDVVETAPSYDLLVGPGIEIVVHAIPPSYAASIDISEPPRLREETPFKPVFVVRDLERVRIAAAATGGGLNSVESAWRYHDTLVIDGHDPEGNVVQFRRRDA